jgi:hypothetical protein
VFWKEPACGFIHKIALRLYAVFCFKNAALWKSVCGFSGPNEPCVGARNYTVVIRYLMFLACTTMCENFAHFLFSRRVFYWKLWSDEGTLKWCETKSHRFDLLSFLVKYSQTSGFQANSSVSVRCCIIVTNVLKYYKIFPFVTCMLNLMNLKLFKVIFKNLVRTAKKTPHSTVTKINWLTLFKEIIAVYS